MGSRLGQCPGTDLYTKGADRTVTDGHYMWLEKHLLFVPRRASRSSRRARLRGLRAELHLSTDDVIEGIDVRIQADPVKAAKPEQGIRGGASFTND